MANELADELVHVVDAAAAMLRTIPDDVAAVRRAPGVWSIKELVGHLIDSAANNHQRFVRAQHVDAFAWPGYEQDAWVGSQGYQGLHWSELVDFWQLYNRHLAHVIRRIPDDALHVSCRIGENDAVSLRFLVEDYVAHLRHHLEQVPARQEG